mmetsp:Transcript_62776/g.166592  ORF Transcript_62776/g.166592 Transcript_62776/m.166592 type:complete len:283 (-) Transcript_62776:191-1039(-)
MGAPAANALGLVGLGAVKSDTDVLQATSTEDPRFAAFAFGGGPPTDPPTLISSCVPTAGALAAGCSACAFMHEASGTFAFGGGLDSSGEATLSRFVVAGSTEDPLLSLRPTLEERGLCFAFASVDALSASIASSLLWRRLSVEAIRSDDLRSDESFRSDDLDVCCGASRKLPDRVFLLLSGLFSFLGSGGGASCETDRRGTPADALRRGDETLRWTLSSRGPPTGGVCNPDSAAPSREQDTLGELGAAGTAGVSSFTRETGAASTCRLDVLLPCMLGDLIRA